MRKASRDMDFKGKIAIITGSAQDICIDGGMTHQMIYHGDHGWTLETK
jgi:hypothetical protein